MLLNLIAALNIFGGSPGFRVQSLALEDEIW
jgi:hypothetical protein